jgi:uncharacterized protein
MARVVHFELFAEDPKKAVEFYEKVFGWEIKNWEGPFDYWLAMTGEAGTLGIDGAIAPPGSGGDQRVINTVGVENLDDAAERVKQAGGRLVTEKAPVPGVGWFLYAADPTGIVFGMMQPDMSAGMPA